MGRIFLLEFDEPDNDYYMCKMCRTHIALQEDFYCFHFEDEQCEAVFHKAVNLQVDKPDQHRQVGDHTVADVYCVKCGDKLGWKYIQVGGEQVTFQNGDVKLDMEKLLRMYENQILDAVTMETAPEDPPENP